MKVPTVSEVMIVGARLITVEELCEISGAITAGNDLRLALMAENVALRRRIVSLESANGRLNSAINGLPD